MGRAREQIRKRRFALEKISELSAHPEHMLVIHYSCESFYNRPAGGSARIASIAVSNFSSGQTSSFSIHQMAEMKKIAPNDIDANFDKLERAMLDEFYKYTSARSTFSWVHWNMINANYGFQAIEHRHRVLGGKPSPIDDSKIFNLAGLLHDIYGSGYIEHPRMENLIDYNNLSKQDFLKGEDEAVAFERKEYVKLHQSTLKKVQLITDIARKTASYTLKTKTRWRDIYGHHPEAFAEWIRENWIMVLIVTSVGFLASTTDLLKEIIQFWGRK